MVLTVKLGVAYFNQGFINIQKRYSEYFGNDNEIIKIHLGTWDEVIIEGRINRTAQNSGAPRIIMGSKFTTWVQKNYNFNEIITIVILNPQYPNKILIKDKRIR